MISLDDLGPSALICCGVVRGLRFDPETDNNLAFYAAVCDALARHHDERGAEGGIDARAQSALFAELAAAVRLAAAAPPRERRALLDAAVAANQRATARLLRASDGPMSRMIGESALRKMESGGGEPPGSA